MASDSLNLRRLIYLLVHPLPHRSRSRPRIFPYSPLTFSTSQFPRAPPQVRPMLLSLVPMDFSKSCLTRSPLARPSSGLTLTLVHPPATIPSESQAMDLTHRTLK